MNSRFVYVTGNEGKRKRMREILGDTFRSEKLDLDEIQDVDPKRIAEHKARQAFAELHETVLVEDTSLHIESLGGLPGPMIKWFLSSVGLAGICKITSGDRRAYATNTFALFDGADMHFFVGRIDGVIPKKPRGDGGFGWDSIFIIDGHDKTRAELTEAENAASSGRAKAMKQLQAFFESDEN